tara:strand:- start:1004 stop:1618 length:615 start_codon:yes stop_codon:yes gene_type:complete
MNRGTVAFSQMKDATQADYDLLSSKFQTYREATAGRVLETLQRQAIGHETGHQIHRLDHALQCATRARVEGADIDWIGAALLHDIGDGLAPMNHDRFAAEILRPFLREEVTWVVAHHGAFQLIYSGEFTDRDPNTREQFSNSPYYQSCVDFCERWDQSSFDPSYENDPLDSFRDEIDTIFSRTPFDPRHLCAGEVVGLPSGLPQ